MTLSLWKGIGIGGLILGWSGINPTAMSLEHQFEAIALSSCQQALGTQKRASKLSISQYGYLLSQAQAITVKVETPFNQGSGVLVSHNSDTYTVITNDHVILDSDRLTIQTADGRRHHAQQNHQAHVGNADLAVLEFESAQIHYPIARLAPGLTINNGSLVLSAGFPYELNEDKGQSLQVTQGNISQVIQKGLNGGYQIGYSNWVPKGMSGGPVLNVDGQVIAINGLHAEPLWGNPYVWDDGSVPAQHLFSVLADSSWAIPAETVLKVIHSR